MYAIKWKIRFCDECRWSVKGKKLFEVYNLYTQNPNPQYLCEDCLDGKKKSKLFEVNEIT